VVGPSTGQSGLGHDRAALYAVNFMADMQAGMGSHLGMLLQRVWLDYWRDRHGEDHGHHCRHVRGDTGATNGLLHKQVLSSIGAG
jgi:hypothetical protein